MRNPNLGSVTYAPADPPQNPAEMRGFLLAEFQKIGAAVSGLAAGHLDKSYVAPAKPRDGDWRYADGVFWNPGSGKGFYRFDGDTTTWVFLLGCSSDDPHRYRE
jgi:hypothetical protein